MGYIFYIDYHRLDYPQIKIPKKSRKKPLKKTTNLKFDEMKHVSIVHVCSCLLCIKKDYIAMCVMFDIYSCFATGLM